MAGIHSSNSDGPAIPAQPATHLCALLDELLDVLRKPPTERARDEGWDFLELRRMIATETESLGYVRPPVVHDESGAEVTLYNPDGSWAGSALPGLMEKVEYEDWRRTRMISLLERWRRCVRRARDKAAQGKGGATATPGPLTSGEIQRLCTAGEDQATEFKDSRVEARTVAKEVAAMLHNSCGGRILVGISDDGNIVGCSATRQGFDQSLQNALRNSVRPAPTAAVHEVPIDAKRVLVVVVPPWNGQDVYQYEGRVQVRKGTNVFQADPAECRRLHSGLCLPDS